MIHVDRDRERVPEVLLGEQAAAAREQAAAHFANEDAAARQQLFEFEPLYEHPDVRAALMRLFAGKCAFCESPLDGFASSPVTHHLRPTQEAVDLAGAVSRPHYHWLAYEWENLYLACQRCASASGANFPIFGERAPVGATGATLLQEQPLLIDPCRDDPYDHLVFAADGTVRPVTARGAHTISVHALNRSPLIEARRMAIAEARQGPRPVTHEQPYAGAIRQVVLGVGGQPPADYFEDMRLSRLLRLVRRAARRWVVRWRRSGRPPEPLQPVVVERLELRDFRGVERLELTLAGPDDAAPWTMLLGENGHGKTSVLQALALLLMGADAREELELDADAFVRHGAEHAEIVAQVRGELEPRRLRIVRGGGFDDSGAGGAAAVAAYGAARIPSTRRRGASARSAELPRVESLFDAGTPLVDADRWLASRDEASFDFAGRALRRLLLAPEDTLVVRHEAGVALRSREGSQELRELSDGYRSMIALAADVMSFFMTRFGSMDAAEGIVLVDELGAHLHPRWQMRVVEAFREAFPRLQFVATTHDPLCLRGLRDACEVVVLRRTDEGEVYALPRDEVPSVRGLQVDQLLTSEVFGLSSTVDPALERDFERYYALLGSPAPDAAERREIAELRERLAAHRQLGTTRRERLALEAADEYLAREPDVAGAADRERLLEQTKRQLRAIWAGEEG